MLTMKVPDGGIPFRGGEFLDGFIKLFFNRFIYRLDYYSQARIRELRQQVAQLEQAIPDYVLNSPPESDSRFWRRLHVCMKTVCSILSRPRRLETREQPVQSTVDGTWEKKIFHAVMPLDNVTIRSLQIRMIITQYDEMYDVQEAEIARGRR